MQKKQSLHKIKSKPLKQFLRQQLILALEPKLDSINPGPDIDHMVDLNLFFARTQENISYLERWKNYEILELLKQEISIGKVTLAWLCQFREDLDLKV